MRVCIISAVFPPEPVVSAKTSAQIAEAMSHAGAEVVVITAFPSRPSGKKFQGYQRKLFQAESSPDGYRIIRCFTFFSVRSTLASRFAENISFGIIGGFALAFMKKPDAVYANTWPILSSLIYYLISKLRRIPLVLSIQDLYPESLSTQGRLQQNSAIYRLFLWIDGIIARGSQAVIAISDGFKNAYRDLRKVDDNKIFVIPNWANLNEIQLDVPTKDYRNQIGIPGDGFVIAYGGNIGYASGVETLLEAINQIELDCQIYLVLAGEGSRLAYCQEAASKIPGDRVIVHSPWHVRDTSLVLRSADLLILPTSNDQSLSSIPSKLVYYMLAARPILAVVHPKSETAKIITQANCGWVISSSEPDVLAKKLVWVRNSPVEYLDRYGKSGREYALNHFSRDSCLPKVTTLIQEIATSSIRTKRTTY